MMFLQEAWFCRTVHACIALATVIILLKGGVGVGKEGQAI